MILSVFFKKLYCYHSYVTPKENLKKRLLLNDFRSLKKSSALLAQATEEQGSTKHSQLMERMDDKI